jgi:hypothetical protein
MILPETTDHPVSDLYFEHFARKKQGYGIRSAGNRKSRDRKSIKKRYG